ncbi:hypothetical protein GQ55_3G100100 [Panicum hallii var. hallii]|uniref:Uncharacterized protein n=1 Tax=Panicum hallii var. hallii TaxID=1504633 RepID=A0A2T7E7P7_9POAL|nr:hypothetical protein GQ55_3G100100 [Panicum hallii var. hallii]
MEIPFSFRDAAESKQRHSLFNLRSLQPTPIVIETSMSSHADGAGSAGGPEGRVSPRFSSDASSFTPIELLHGFTQRSQGRTLALVRNHCLSHQGSEMVALKVVHAGVTFASH